MNSDIFFDLDGLISDAMGHLRDGDYEVAEKLLENNAIDIIERLPEPDKTLETVKILRKLSVVYEYQDRVDDCNEAWQRANDLEKKPKFGARPHQGWKLTSPPSSAAGRARVITVIGDGGSAATVSTREDVANGVHDALQRVEAAKKLHETRVAANERYISSVLSMAREDTEYATTRRLLTSTTSPQTTSRRPGSPTTPTPTATPTATRTTGTGTSTATTTASATKHRREKKKRKTNKKNSNKKTQTIDELKKLIKSEPENAGGYALKMARKYTDIRQPKKAMIAYKTALHKEIRNFANIEEEQRDLTSRWSKIRGMKEKREAEELKVQLANDWNRSEGIIVRSHIGMVKLLLSQPIAALDSEIVVATMPSQIEEARTWFPTQPKTNTTLQGMYCAGPIVDIQCRAWMNRFIGLERPMKRRKAQHQIINMLDGAVTGPLGDLYGEVMEEILETNVDGDNLHLLDMAGIFYTRRRHFRRANEILVRSEALRRGEKRSFGEPRRKLGEELLTFGKHLDPSVDLYLASMPPSISGKLTIKQHSRNDTKTIDQVRTSLIERGESGSYGVDVSDTWRGNLVNLVNPAGNTERDSLIMPTTIGRSRDEQSDSKYLIRSVGVDGSLVAAVGSTQIITRLQKGDLKSSKIPRGNPFESGGGGGGGSGSGSGSGGGAQVKWRDELDENRRRKGHADMWHHHDAKKKLKQNYNQGEISKGQYVPEGIPKRHWLEPSAKEKIARAEILKAANTAADGPPPSSAALLGARRSMAESQKLSTSALAKKFGSAGLMETERLQMESRARVFELPPPVRNPLQTPGTRATLSSRGGMAFWMDNMQTLEVDENTTSFPGRKSTTAGSVVERSRGSSRMGSVASSGGGGGGGGGDGGDGGDGGGDGDGGHGVDGDDDGDDDGDGGRGRGRKKSISTMNTRSTQNDTKEELDALDFLERPPTVLPDLSSRSRTRGSMGTAGTIGTRASIGTRGSMGTRGSIGTVDSVAENGGAT